MAEIDWPIRDLEEVSAPLDSDLYLELEPLVNDVAWQEWKNSTLFSAGDVAQAIWEHMMANWAHYEGREEGLVRHMARRAARGFCMAQRVQYMYATGAYLYTPAMVRRILEDAAWCSPGDCKDIEGRADISEAFRHLPKGQKAAIYKRYALKELLTRGAEQVAESRGVTAMTDRLNAGLRLRPDLTP